MRSSLSQLKQKQTIVRILVFSLVTVMIWVGFSLFRSQRKTVISPDLQQLALPLNPNLDLETVSRIEQKRSFQPDELSNFPVYRLVRDQSGKEQLVTTQERQRLPLDTPEPSPTPLP